MLSTRSVCKAVTSAGVSGNAPDESEYCAFGLEYCRKCHPKGGGLQYLRLDSGQAQTTKKADVLALLDRNGPGPNCRSNVAYANDDGCDADDEREDGDEHGSAADHKRRRVNISS